MDQKVEVEYDNENPIAFEYFGATRAEPRPGQKISVEFWVTNQAEKEYIKNVEVRLFDPRGFDIVEIDCGYKCTCSNELNETTDCDDKTSCISDVLTGDYNGCNFTEIQSLDRRRVNFNLKAPHTEGQREISFSAKYDFSDVSVLTFPILDSREEGTEARKHFNPAIGPIKVDVDAGFEVTRIVEGREERITNWAMEGEPLSMELTTRNVGNLGPNHKYPKIYIDNATNFTLTLINIQPEDGRCDFISRQVDPSKYVLTPKENVTVPTDDPLVCDLLTNYIEVPRVTGMIIADYSYRYEFIRKQSFEVKERLGLLEILGIKR